MLTYVSAFISGGLEPFWPHFWLLSVSVLSSFAVAGGILLEKPKYSPSVHKIANWLVVGGVAIEAACTIALFVFDEGISQKQQVEIIRLTTPRNLSPEAVKRVAEAVCPFGPQPLQITAVTLDELLLRNEFDQIFKLCNWKGGLDSSADTDALVASLSGLKGIRFGYSTEHAAQFEPVSKTFAAALVKEGVEARAELIPPNVIPKINVIEIQIGQRP